MTGLRIGRKVKHLSYGAISKPVGGAPGSVISGGDHTVGTIMQIPSTAVWIRFRFTCWSAAGYRIASAAYSPTAMTGDGWSAFDDMGTITTELWKPITFNMDGVNVECMQQITSPTIAPKSSIEIPGVVGSSLRDFEPTVVCSDWLPIKPIAPIRGGDTCLVNVRTYVPALSSAFTLDYADSPSATLGVTLCGACSRGNQAIPPYLGQGHIHPVSAVHGLDTLCSRPIHTICAVGDSISSGDYSTGRCSSYVLQAVQALNRLGYFVSAAVLANPLQPTSTFLRNAFKYMFSENIAFPSMIVIIQCWSGNDHQSLKDVEKSFADAIAFAQFCLSQGSVPILATAAPVCGMDAPHEVLRRASNQAVRQSGFLIFDMDRILRNDTRPASYKEDYGAWDNVHVSDEGHRVLAEELIKMVPDFVVRQTARFDSEV